MPSNLPAGNALKLNAMSISDNDYYSIASLGQRDLVSEGEGIGITCSPDLFWKGNYMKFDAYSPVDNNYLSIKDGRASTDQFVLNYIIPDAPEGDFQIFISDLYELGPNYNGNVKDVLLNFKQVLSRLSLVIDDSYFSGTGTLLSVKSVNYKLGFSSATITANHTSGVSTQLDANSKTVVPNYIKVEDSGTISLGDSEDQYMYSRYLPACSSNSVQIEVDYLIRIPDTNMANGYVETENVISFDLTKVLSSFDAGREYRVFFKPTATSYSISIAVQGGGGGGTK